MTMIKKTIHVYRENKYIWNIMYSDRIPYFSEEEFRNEILKHFPSLI